MAQYGVQERIQVSKGGSSSQLELNYGAYAHGVVLDCFRPDKSTDNAFIEAFNNRFWQECLNEHWFLSLEDAQEKIEGWRGHYIEHRPHSSLEYQSPVVYRSGIWSGAGELNASRVLNSE